MHGLTGCMRLQSGWWLHPRLSLGHHTATDMIRYLSHHVLSTSGSLQTRLLPITLMTLYLVVPNSIHCPDITLILHSYPCYHPFAHGMLVSANSVIPTTQLITYPYSCDDPLLQYIMSPPVVMPTAQLITYPYSCDDPLSQYILCQLWYPLPSWLHIPISVMILYHSTYSASCDTHCPVDYISLFLWWSVHTLPAVMPIAQLIMYNGTSV